MSLMKCNKCGEMYSDSYKKCPFCAEDEEYYNGKVKKRGHRQLEKKRKAPSVVGPLVLLAVVVLAAVLVWVFAGDTVKGWFGGGKDADTDHGTQQQEPVTPPDNGNTPTKPENTELKLDQVVLELAPGDTRKLTVSGGTGETYQWITSNADVLKVDDGTVTALSEGTAVVTVTCGDESVACAVTVREGAAATPPDTSNNGGGTTTNKPDNSSDNNNNKPDNSSDNNNNKPDNSTDNKPSTGTTLTNLKIKTMYGTYLDKNPDGQFDMTVGKNDPACELTLEGVTGTATWKSSNTNVVKVSDSGTVERVSSGEATITITVGSGTAEILVRVN